MGERVTVLKGGLMKWAERRPADTIPLLASDGLERLSTIDAHAYASAFPFAHVVIDDIFNPAALRAVLAEWPFGQTNEFESHDDGTFVRLKRGTTWKTPLGANTQRFFAEFSAPPFLNALEKATAIRALIPDPYMLGGGLHQTAVGGRLAVHADYNRHPIYQLDRRLNVLIYLNEGWTEKNGGALELWQPDMARCSRTVLPVFNRMVIFSTTHFSFHGQPEAVVGAPGTTRRSIALYYFSNGRPESEVKPEHTTLWQERPGEGY